MISRRTILALFGAAPTLGPAVSAEAMRTSGAPMGPSPFEPVSSGPETALAGSERNPVTEAIWEEIYRREREMEKQQTERYRRRDAMRIAGFEPGVAAPRSWSGVFRVYIQVTRDLAEHRRREAEVSAFRKWRDALLNRGIKDYI